MSKLEPSVILSMIAVATIASILPARANQVVPQHVQPIKAAQFAVAQGTPALSGDRLIAAIRLNPNDLNLRRTLAAELIKRGLTVKAAEQIKEVMAVSGESAADLMLYAEACRYSGDEHSAIDAYKKSLRLEPMNAKAWSGLSLAYAQNGDKQTAVNTCRSGLSQIIDLGGRRQLSTTLNSIEQMASPAAEAHYAS
jgi:Flp pilus assembly protein TadD